MPRILKTVVPRIRKSVEERGLLVSLYRSVLLPIHLLREYREAARPKPRRERSEFDQEYGVETDGDVDRWTYLSDLDIPSPNWIHGNNYAAIEPARFQAIVETLSIRFEDFVFLDLGSGKGRALLLASEVPFRRITGIEFSPELHAIALRNIAKFNSARGRCAVVESVCGDFLEFALPLEPSVLFFFDPCDERALGKMLARISKSLGAHPREMYLVYVAPTAGKERLLEGSGCFEIVVRNLEHNFCVYRSRARTPSTPAHR